MSTDYAQLMAAQIPTITQHYDWRDCVVYALGIGVGHGQFELQLGELAVGGGQHQKYQHDQQDVNERNQVDLWRFSLAGTKVHGQT